MSLKNNFLIILFITVVFSPCPLWAKNPVIKNIEKTKRVLNLTTFNTGLAHKFVPYAPQRRANILTALQNSNSDILCLQEVWRKEDRDFLIQGLKVKFPWSYSLPIEQKLSSQAPVCHVQELFGSGKFGRCMVDFCLKEKGDAFTSCVINTCRKPLDELKSSNRECATSLMAQVDVPLWRGLMNVFNPWKKAGLFAYGGSDGLILLSKFPFSKVEHLSWENDSTLNRRNLLIAEVNVRNKTHHVTCTHLTANLSLTAPYTGKYQSWEEENAFQIDQFLNKVAKLERPLYLLGDFNCSIPSQNGNVSGDFSKACQKFLDDKFLEPVLEINPQCSFCQSNLINADKKEGDLLIDHIFIKGAPPKKVDVIFREKIKVQAEKQEITTQLSDHYGVSVQVPID